MKKIKLFFALCALPQSTALTAHHWQTWFSKQLRGAINDKTRVEITLENRFAQTIRTIRYAHIEPILFYTVNDGNAIGIQMRHIVSRKEKHSWPPVVRPGIVLLHTIKGKYVDITSRIKFLYNIARGESHGLVRARLGATCFKNDTRHLFMHNELFYNHNQRQRVDKNRSSIGFTYNFSKTINGGAYYLHEICKPTIQSGWHCTHVLGLTLVTTF